MENSFITYQQALSIIEDHKGSFSTQLREIHTCVGAIVAEDIIADRDFPPFDRVTMDGIAINFSTFQKGQRSFTIEAIAPAGAPQLHLKSNTNCIEVMTGAILPIGVDCVIRYEDLEIKESIATVIPNAVKHKQNIHFKGIDILKGTTIVAKGKKLSSAEINIAASVGKATLQVVKMPKIIIFSTGDELVEVDKNPELHQIRRSNVYGIQATLKEWGIPADLHHIADNKEDMHNAIATSLKNYDALIFTGGVSKGKFDYLPEVLETLHVQKRFHKIQQRPGKPFWFGTNADNKKIFALPGNPVSSFICTYIYLKHWLEKSLNLEQEKMYVKLQSNVTFKPNLTYFLEAKIKNLPNGELVAEPIKGNGSGDFANLINTDGFLILPQGRNEFRKGEVYPYVSYRMKW